MIEELNYCRKLLKPFNIFFTDEEITSSSRKAELVYIRALIVAILRAKGYTLYETAAVINRDHATVNHMQHHYEHGTYIKHFKFKEVRDFLIETLGTIGGFETDPQILLKAKIELLQGQIKKMEKELKKYEQRNQPA